MYNPYQRTSLSLTYATSKANILQLPVSMADLLILAVIPERRLAWVSS